MQHECRITVLETKVFPEYQEKYLADPKSGPCPCFQEGDTFLLKRTAERDDFYHLMNGKFCGEAWDAISRYVYTALQGGSIMHKWTNDERMMIACCNDGTRPVIFKIERIDIPETEEEREWLEKQNFQEYGRGCLHRLNQGQAHHNTQKVEHTGPLCLFQGYLIKAERSHERSAFS